MTMEIRWSEELQLWLGAWRGSFLAEEHTWLRFYHADGRLALLTDEAASERAEAELQRLRGGSQG